MLTSNTAMSEVIRLIDGKSGACVTGTPVATGWNKAQTTVARRLLGLARVTGAWTDAETLTLRWEKASDGSGTGAATVKEIVFAAHATDNDDLMAMLDISHLDYDTAKPFMRLSAIASGASGGQIAVLVVGGDLRYTPEDDSVTGLTTGLKKILRGATGS
jgi:hypothetical protein